MRILALATSLDRGRIFCGELLDTIACGHLVPFVTEHHIPRINCATSRIAYRCFCVASSTIKKAKSDAIAKLRVPTARPNGNQSRTPIVSSNSPQNNAATIEANVASARSALVRCGQCARHHEQTAHRPSRLPL